jgi:hypothetical protein
MLIILTCFEHGYLFINVGQEMSEVAECLFHCLHVNAHSCDGFCICIYRVSQEEMSRLHHLILGAILSKKCNINMGLIRNGYLDMQVSAFG